MRFTSIASGSSGNVSYIGTDSTHILIDAGVTMKAISKGLRDLELGLEYIQAIFLTHEHIDHIRAVGTITRKYDIPVYGTLETLREIVLCRKLGAIRQDLLHPLLPDVPVEIGNLKVIPFSIYHDAANPVCYRVESPEGSAAVATDTGHFDDYIRDHLKNLDAMLVEANHDVGMLERGSYPVNLKRRILSDHGHLNNNSSGELIDAVLNDGIRHIFLGHLSLENNLPELALSTVRSEISGSDGPYKGTDFDISVAKRDGISEIVEFRHKKY